MNRPLLAAAAALIIVIAGTALLLRPSTNVGPQVSPTPIPTGASQPTGSANAVPAELMHSWVGVPHDFPGRSNVQALNFAFQFGQLIVSVNYVYGQDAFASHAAVVGERTLELRTVANGCAVDAVGRYTWSLSPGGTLLHLAVVDDACAARSVALAGDWHSANCKDQTDVCWGDLEAGTYPTLFYSPRLGFAEQPGPQYGGVTFTVPDGWAVGGDHTTDFRLLRSTEYAREGATGPLPDTTEIEAWIRPTNVLPDSGCAATPTSTTEGTPAGLINWLRNRMSGVSTTPAQAIEIDGLAGSWIDLSVLPDWTQICPGADLPSVPLITEAVGGGGSAGDAPYVVGIAGQARMRLIFIDVSQPELRSSHTAMILITAPNQAAFDAFIDEAMPIVKSFHFR